MNSPYLKVLLLSWITVSHVRAESYERFLTQFCVRCHGAESTEQDFNIERLSRDFKAGVTLIYGPKLSNGLIRVRYRK